MIVPRHHHHSPFWTTAQREAHREAHDYTLMPLEEDLDQFQGLAGAVRNFVPCVNRISSIDTPGRPCGHCGHTDLAHGGVHQPEVFACAVCMLLIAWLRTVGS